MHPGRANLGQSAFISLFCDEIPSLLASNACASRIASRAPTGGAANRQRNDELNEASRSRRAPGAPPHPADFVGHLPPPSGVEDARLTTGYGGKGPAAVEKCECGSLIGE